ncbi:DUF58 domain-containing protein [Sporosarcina aquimarina]|uniref:DUF58 domain-containing protein n=1 Tax=Sporosarcina aquimarina TaxID=114975 RepID=A0ABU4G140_9BACL|nr:DUF58 domain-containing protein [Sporosarcina aquimarina]MDW0110658.1 DUF58 domain-containing protein [Sporosarcina aquimarina]
MIKKHARFTFQLIFVLIVLGGAYTFAMFQGGMASWTIFYFVLPFAIYALCIALYPVSRMTVTRSIQQPLLSIKEKTTVTVRIKRNNRFPLVYLLVKEHFKNDFALISDGQPSRLFTMGFKKEIELQYEVKGQRRGEHAFAPIQLEIADFFGWIKKQTTIEVVGESTLLIFPETKSIHYVPIGSHHDPGSSKSPFSLIKETTVATSVRDYQPGDRVAWIHWKSFARTQSLMTKEFENKRGEHVSLLLDARSSEVFEEQIRFAASILKEAAARKADLTFLTTDAEQAVIRMISAEGELRKALTQLARMNPIEETTTKQPSYGAALQGSGAIVMISGNPDAVFLRKILSAARSQPVYCFVIRNSEEPLSTFMQQNVMTARAQGVIVQLLTAEQFERSFQEVARA